MKYRDAILSVSGFCLLLLAVLADKHVLVLKAVLSMIVAVLTLYFIMIQFRRLIINEKRWLSGIFILGSMFFYLFRLMSLLSSSYWEYKSLMLLILVQIPAYLLLSSYVISGTWEKKFTSIYDNRLRLVNRIAFFSILLFTGLIFFYSPITLHASDPESLPFPLIKLILWHGLYYSVSAVLIYVFYRLSGKSLRLMLSSLFFVLAVTSWFYTYLLPGDYGLLDVVYFSNPGRLIGLDRLYGMKEHLLQLLEALLLVLGGGGLVFLFFRYGSKLFPLLIVLNLMTLGQTAANIISKPELWKIRNTERSSGQAYLPDAAETVYHFSRKGNIVIFMLDMFTGALVPRIFDEYPELKKSFEGFVWYPNTLSVGTSTYPGLPALLAGEDYAPHKVNECEDRLMSRMLEEAYSYYPSVSREMGYEMTYVNPVYFNLEERSQEWGVHVVDPGVFKEYWLNTSEEAAALNLKLSSAYYSRLFSIIGLFKASPHFIRPYIYLEGRWLMQNRGQLEADHAITHLAVMDLWNSLSYVDDGPPQFKFIDNELSHPPFSIDTDLNLEMASTFTYLSGTGYDFPVVGGEMPYRSDARLLFEMARLLDWMREHNVYDQTKIVLVSDHGYNGINESWTDMPVIRNRDGRDIGGSAGVNGLLMVKDYNSCDDFRVDDRLMSTADTPLIALSLPDDPTLGEPGDREVFVSYTPAAPEDNGRYQYDIEYQFAVVGDPKKPDNWHQIIP